MRDPKSVLQAALKEMQVRLDEAEAAALKVSERVLARCQTNLMFREARRSSPSWRSAFAHSRWSSMESRGDTRWGRIR